MYTQHYCHLVSRPPLRFLLLTLGTQTYAELPPVTTNDVSCSVPLGLVSTQAPLISCSTHSAKLPFLQKAATYSRRDCRIHMYSRLWWTAPGGYVRDELNIRVNAPSPLFSKRSVQKGVIFSGAYGTCVLASIMSSKLGGQTIWG